MRWKDDIDYGDVNMTTATSPSGAPDNRGFSICSSTLNYFIVLQKNIGISFMAQVKKIYMFTT